jgi:hypothetical protein
MSVREQRDRTNYTILGMPERVQVNDSVPVVLESSRLFIAAGSDV